MPTGEAVSILLSHLYQQTRCAASVKQTNSVFVKSGSLIYTFSLKSHGYSQYN